MNRINKIFHVGIIEGLLLLLIILLGVSCNQGTAVKNEFSVKYENSIIQYAKRLKIENKNNYSQVTVYDPWQDAKGISQSWYLVKKGSKPPAESDPASVIFIPVKRIICMSTTHVAMISALDEENSIAGMSGTDFLFNESILEKSENGLIGEIGYEENLNKERIIGLSPDILIAYGIGSESAGYLSKLIEMGIKILFNADYLEEDPLGKAEWIKLFGALYGKEYLADSLFTDMENKYLSLKNYINENINARPEVLLGLPFRDTWYISPGNSYISCLIDDAGGNYLWRDNHSSVSMPLGIENVYLKAVNADYWLNTGNINNKKEILAIDGRLASLRCFKEGNVFNNNKRVSPKGGNDYWENGCINPHIILKDIASILHPYLFNEKGDEYFFYKKIE